jgi:hypothetical protein
MSQTAGAASESPSTIANARFSTSRSNHPRTRLPARAMMLL